MCRVVHFKKEKYDVYCGRPSFWGNPYSHKEETLAEFKVASRKEAIAKFEQHLLNNPEMMSRLHELKFKTLGCWCKPKSCHCDVLKKYVDLLEKEIEPLF